MKSRTHPLSLRDLSNRGELAWSSTLLLVKPVKVRIRVACIAWFDFQSELPISKQSPTLRHWKNRYTEDITCSDNTLYKALVTIGYPDRVAKKRAYTSYPTWQTSRGGWRCQKGVSSTAAILRFVSDSDVVEASLPITPYRVHEPDPWERLDSQDFQP